MKIRLMLFSLCLLVGSAVLAAPKAKLAVKQKIGFGTFTVQVTRVGTADDSPVNHVKPGEGKKLLLVSLDVLAIKPDAEISTAAFVLEAGKELLTKPGAWGKIELMGSMHNFEARDGSTLIISSASKPLNLFFEVPMDARPKDFVLGYQPPVPQDQSPPPTAGQANSKEASTAVVEVELAEAVMGGLVRVTLTGQDGGERVDVAVERRLAMPMTILVPKGTSTLGGSDSIAVSSDVDKRIDLSKRTEGLASLQPGGGQRIVKGKQSIEACFNTTTGKILKRLGSDRGALLFGQVIAQLKEVEVVKRKLAVKALGEAGDTKALPALQDIVQHDPNADVREAAQAAIAQLRP